MSARASETGAASPRGQTVSKPDAGVSLRDRIRSMFATGRLPALIVALSLVIVLYGLLFSADYDVRTVQVDGAAIGDPGAIAERAAVMDESIFRINPQEAADRLASLPYVESVRVTVDFPAEVHIQVTERVPVAAWQAEGESHLVDASGNVLSPISSPAAGGIPVIVSDGARVAPGDRVDSGQVRVVEALLASPLRDEIQRFSWKSSTGLTVHLSENRRALLGPPDDAGMKIAALQELLPAIEDDWQTLDLTVPERPVYR